MSYRTKTAELESAWGPLQIRSLSWEYRNCTVGVQVTKANRPADQKRPFKNLFSIFLKFHGQIKYLFFRRCNKLQVLYLSSLDYISNKQKPNSDSLISHLLIRGECDQDAQRSDSNHRNSMGSWGKFLVAHWVPWAKLSRLRANF